MNGSKNKGIIIGSNGSVFSSERLSKTLRIKDASTRASWDIPNPKEEHKLRKYPHKMYENKDGYIIEKKAIKYVMDNGIEASIQSVLHGQNYNDPTFHRFLAKLKELNVDRWYI